jgi:hypothetical protein
MATIRLAILEQMKKKFDQTVFSRHMFDVSITEPDYILKIEFQGKEDYIFFLKEISPPKQNRFYFVTIESPGQIATEIEEFDHENLNNAQNRVYQWASRIEEDYRMAIPDDAELENFRKEFFGKFNKSEVDDSPFSTAEQAEVNQRMNEFEKKLEKLYQDKEATNQQLNVMRQQVEILKRSVEVLDKRTWLSAACNRIFDIYKEVKAAKNEVSGLLGDMNKLLSNGTEEEIVNSENTVEEVI